MNWPSFVYHRDGLDDGDARASRTESTICVMHSISRCRSSFTGRSSIGIRSLSCYLAVIPYASLASLRVADVEGLPGKVIHWNLVDIEGLFAQFGYAPIEVGAKFQDAHEAVAIAGHAVRGAVKALKQRKAEQPVTLVALQGDLPIGRCCKDGSA